MNSKLELLSGVKLFDLLKVETDTHHLGKEGKDNEARLQQIDIVSERNKKKKAE